MERIEGGFKSTVFKSAVIVKEFVLSPLIHARELREENKHLEAKSAASAYGIALGLGVGQVAGIDMSAQTLAIAWFFMWSVESILSLAMRREHREWNKLDKLEEQIKQLRFPLIYYKN